MILKSKKKKKNFRKATAKHKEVNKLSNLLLRKKYIRVGKKQSAKMSNRSFRCGTTGSVVFLECWNTGSIPSQAQWVKGSAVATDTA